MELSEAFDLWTGGREAAFGSLPESKENCEVLLISGRGTKGETLLDFAEKAAVLLSSGEMMKGLLRMGEGLKEVSMLRPVSDFPRKCVRGDIGGELCVGNSGMSGVDIFESVRVGLLMVGNTNGISLGAGGLGSSLF